MQKIKNDLKPYFKLQNYKQFLVPILVMFGIYLLGIFSIIRINISYLDDLGRAALGYREWWDTNRYVSDLLSTFLHTDRHLTDISPLPQIFAVFFLAISSVILVYILCNKKILKLALITSIPIGLSPFFLQCLSFKFDSPYMALSILVSIFPFIFTKNRIVFSIVSFISVLVMSMTYQASSSIYLMLAIMLSFQEWVFKKKNNKEIFRFLLIAMLSYSIALLTFRFAFMRYMNLHASTDSYPINEMLTGIIKNFTIYTERVTKGLSVTWKILSILLCLCFIVKAILISKQNKILTAFTSTLLIVALFVISFGAYLILIKPIYEPRAIYGATVFIALLGIFTTNYTQRYFAIPAIVFSWCFFVFAFSYGNALSDQKRYDEFRTETLIHDLNELFPNKENTLQISIKGFGGYSAVVENIAKRNPIIKPLVPVYFQQSLFWSRFYLGNYYNFNLTYNSPVKDLDSVWLDSRYHTIKSDGKQVLIILK